MRYIRTNSFIVDSELAYVFTEDDMVIIGGAGWKIVKTSDSLKDLCDCWIVQDKEYVFPTVYNKEDYDVVVELFGNKFPIFGGIWRINDEGPTLLPVTKLNENGELELL